MTTEVSAPPPEVIGLSPTAFRRRLWWLQVSGITVFVIVVPALLAYLLSPDQYLRNWRTPKLFDGWSLARNLLGAACILLGAAIAAGTTRRHRVVVRPPASLLRWRKRCFDVTWTLTLLGTALLFLNAVRNGVTVGEITSLLSGDAGVATAIKQQRFRLIPGLTTLTQFGAAAAVLAGWLPRAEWPGVRRRFWVLVLLAATRSVLMSERLAVIELLVPFGIAVACRRYQAGWRPSARVALAPVLGLFVLVSGFTAFETTRSWGYYSGNDQSLVAFGVTRLEGYYVTAYNNAELNWRFREELYPLPYNTLEFVWQAPLVSSALDYEEVTGVDPRVRYTELLTQEVNPEFANPGGLGVVFADWGLVGGSLVCAGLGFVARRCFDSMLAGRELGELLYPLVALALVELPRFWYLTSGRLFPSLVALAVAALGGVDVKHRAQAAAAASGRAVQPASGSRPRRPRETMTIAAPAPAAAVAAAMPPR